MDNLLQQHGLIDEETRRSSNGRGRVQQQLPIINPGLPQIPTVSSTTSTTSSVTTTMSTRISHPSQLQNLNNPNPLDRQNTLPARMVDDRFEDVDEAAGGDIPQEFRVIFNRMDLASHQVRQMSLEQRAINEDNSRSINQLTRMLGDMMNTQRELLDRITSRDNSLRGSSPVNWQAAEFQLGGSTFAPMGQGLAGGRDHPAASRPQPDNHQERAEPSQDIPLAERINFLQNQLQQLRSTQQRQSSGPQNNLGSSGGPVPQAFSNIRPRSAAPIQNLQQSPSGLYTDDRRWKGIMQSLKMGNLFYPQEGMSVNEFLFAVESRARREGWTQDELLKAMSYILHGTAARWYDANYKGWTDFEHFKSEFIKACGTSTTDHQIIMEISKLRMKPGESPTEFVLKIQQKYQSMQIPPPVDDQVACIRNHLTDELRLLVFARPVFTYEHLFNALHEATRCIDEAQQPAPTVKTVKFQDKPRFGLLQSTPENLSHEEDEYELTNCNVMESSSPSSYNNKYGVQTRPTNNNYSSSYNQRQQNYYRPRMNQPAGFSSNYNRYPSSPPRINRPCFNCGIHGHMFEVCENPRQDVCNYCFEIGHLRNNCSLLVRGNNNSSPQNVQQDNRDTGRQDNIINTEDERKNQ
ncbi:uncharacterized protein LOC128668230 [Microplitis demolitor]|uniref:uncharacterized protein LOC128668230 n=1 Tax=Microplitis demolitor TaxID=69319 RepID=UPI00235B7098|nr:uncharacterized protein LOC128668230 [Microplitis demolitor]